VRRNFFSHLTLRERQQLGLSIHEKHHQEVIEGVEANLGYALRAWPRSDYPGANRQDYIALALGLHMNDFSGNMLEEKRELS